MLNVKTPDEASGIIKNAFAKYDRAAEAVAAAHSVGRVLLNDLVSKEDVPGFDRSTVDGFAVRASDTFGCSENIPAILNLAGEILMGDSAQSIEHLMTPGACIAVSTGGEIPEGADAVVMVEFTEDYSNGMIGVFKPVAPGNNVIFKGDDVTIGKVVLSEGTVLTPHDIGILSALGHEQIYVSRKPVVGVISTGDEIVPVSGKPGGGQIRDVNTPMLLAAVKLFGASVMDFGIIRDDETQIRTAVLSAAESCDIVLISGGSSAGARDMTARVIESEGKMLLHGIAMKPGKPTILGIVREKPVFGLPGHPVAAYMVTELFVRPLLADMMGAVVKPHIATACLSEAIASNHGREEYVAVRLDGGNAAEVNSGKALVAHPVKSKSGLITSLAGVDGYICIPRDCEGHAKGAEVTVTYF